MMGQFLYMCTLWWQHKRKEYAFYVVHYVIFIYFLFGLSYDHIFSASFVARHSGWFSLLQFQPLHIFNYYLYIKFAQYFLETKKLYPWHNKKAVNMMKAVWVCTGISLVSWAMLGPTNSLFATIYLILSVFLMIWAIRLVYLIYTMKTKQSEFIFRGSLFLSIGIFLTYILLSFEQSGLLAKNLAVFYPSVLGVLGEIYFVNAGLNFKASDKRKQLITTQQQLIYELERNKLLQKKRDTVRSDLSLQLNKEIGITLNGIALFAEHSFRQIEKGELGEVERILHRIVDDSNKMVGSINDIVWILSPENDSAARMIARLQLYAFKTCRDNQVTLSFDQQVEASFIQPGMQERRNIYDGYKEILGAVVSSSPENLLVSISLKNGFLHLAVKGSFHGKTISESIIALNQRQFSGLKERSVENETGTYSFTFETHPAG
jgi:hypothetical protein